VQPSIHLPRDREPVPRLVAAESQSTDVRTNICLKALEVTNRQGRLLASLYRLICPKSDQDTESDDAELANRQSPASEETANKTRCPGTIIRHVDPHMSASGQLRSKEILSLEWRLWVGFGD
jgi:hypothetical protein